MVAVGFILVADLPQLVLPCGGGEIDTQAGGAVFVGADVAVGHAGPDVIDDVGIVAALRHAAKEALNGLSATPSAVLLDGKHNWWAEDSLFDVDPLLPQIPVRMEVRGDARCAVIAAASVAAKVERDGLMVVLDGCFPGYDWARNKGYSSPSHIEGLARLGPSDHHRKSWHLPGVREGHR